jgi:hypothetical protein
MGGSAALSVVAIVSSNFAFEYPECPNFRNKR